MEGVLHVLTGPTAVGKTDWALRWAESNEAEIVSCDSLLFYRGMDIGTAKPTPEERRRVPHHLIDICEVTEAINVMDYLARARMAVADIESRGRRVLITGGSGFYLRSFFAPVGDDIEIPASLRNEVAERLDRDGLEALVNELRVLNPDGLGRLDTANPRRVMRALERCRASGRTLADLAAEFAQQPAPFATWDLRVTRLDCEPGELTARIERRVTAMLANGLVGEVEALLKAGVESNPSAARAIGYRETIAALKGELPMSALAAEIAQNTRALVKKQRTWFRTQLPSHRVLPSAEASVERLFAESLCG